MLTIDVTTKFDEYATPDWIGEFKANYQNGGIWTESHLLPNSMRGGYYFIPANSLEEQRDWYSKHGYSRHEAYTLARKHVYEDRQRYLDWLNDRWYFMGVVVTVKLDGIELGSASLWAVESDGGHEYMQDIIKDLTNEALTDAQNNYNKLSLPVDWTDYEVIGA